MTDQIKQLLDQIAEAATEAASYAGQLRHLPKDSPHVVCVPKQLPDSLEIAAASLAVDVRAGNAPRLSELNSRYGGSHRVGHAWLAGNVERYWNIDRRQITVSFMSDLGRQWCIPILEQMNVWEKQCAIQFVHVAKMGDIRISTEPLGSWSFVGTDTQLVPPHQATTNLDGLNPKAETLNDEVKRDIRHQTGHVLGFRHVPISIACMDAGRQLEIVEHFCDSLGWESNRVIEEILADDRNELDSSANDSVMNWSLPERWIQSDDRLRFSSNDLVRIKAAYPRNRQDA